MALTIITGDGQLPNAKATLYTFAADGFFKLSATNTDVGAVTVNIYVNNSGTSRRIGGKDVSLAAGTPKEYPTHTMQAGDTIEGDASVANKVDYKISGATL